MSGYYNEIDPYAAQWLRNLIDAGLIPEGDVDERSIADVDPSDLAGYTQCHFFAGLGGWPYAARLAGWPDNRPVWTGSPPCQPFSVAGQKRGAKDERHLWPELYRLIGACRPAVFMGEQVAAAVGADWFDGVRADLEGVGYACRGVVVPACATNAPHRRDRLWIVAESVKRAPVKRKPQSIIWPVSGCNGDGHVADSKRKQRHRSGPRGKTRRDESTDCCGEFVGHAESVRRIGRANNKDAGWREQPCGYSGPWHDAEWLPGPDGKARRAQPGVRLLAHGIPARVAKLRALGNAIVPQVAAEVMGAYLEAGR